MDVPLIVSKPIIVLINMINLYGVPQTFVDELLHFISADLLPPSKLFTSKLIENKEDDNEDWFRA